MTSVPPVRVRGFGFALPGDPVPLRSRGLGDAERARLDDLGQEFGYLSPMDSTALSIEAAAALANAGTGAGDIGLVITAPALLTAYGPEIPAVAVRAALGLEHAQCLYLGQGCVGVLRGVQLDAQHLRAGETPGDVVVVTGCRASTITRRWNHGSFFWRDGAAAMVLTLEPGPGPRYVDYAEASATADWGAMRVRFGDGHPAGADTGPDDFRITINFDSAADQVAYIRSEHLRFGNVLATLLDNNGITEDDVAALYLPSIGKARIPNLLGAGRPLMERVVCDVRHAHMGGVDNFLFMHEHMAKTPPADGAWPVSMTPAFTAQWAGVLFRYRES
ncbi:MAG: hypothetical protein QF738_08660 [Rhodospirillales bacterium]|jgi:3-oxoacyl-[acyl-carrier-protein] synthase III|nr:hypothetical protein [Rhodospirillales bacterium]